ncbi:MAG: macro domain-containing protein [Clostridia bacterium]|nr:macro domain-containing protein [Bacilli bacterium]MBR3511544.1 macro domain-containing protein [Clostridia bacterium]
MSIIKLVHGSCADQYVDIVVNAANRDLRPGGGICGVIFNKAGYEELNNECKKIKTPLNDGDAVITQACNMENAREIIHAVGPNFSVTPDAFDKLFLAYYNSMKLVKEESRYTIAFPLISSGIFGGNLKNPAKESAKQCIEAYLKYDKEYGEERSINVTLCAYTEEEYVEAKKVFEEYRLDNLVKERCKTLNILKSTDVAEWNKGSEENGVFILGYPIYNKNVEGWIYQMYKLDLTDQNYLENYDKIKNKDENNLTIDEILTTFTFYIRGERFSDGTIDSGIKDGTLVRLSERLNKLSNEV